MIGAGFLKPEIRKQGYMQTLRTRDLSGRDCLGQLSDDDGEGQADKQGSHENQTPVADGEGIFMVCFFFTVSNYILVLSIVRFTVFSG